MEGFDRAAFLWVNQAAGSALDYLFGWPTHLISWPIFLVLFIFMRIWEPRELFWARWRLASIAGLAGSAAANLIQEFIDRPRPLSYFYDEQSRGLVIRTMHGIYLSHSFPSAHTACAFGAAAGLAHQHPKHAPVFFAIAAFLSFSRIYVGAHFPTDVLAGAVIGAAAGWAAAAGLSQGAGLSLRPQPRTQSGGSVD